MSDLANEIRLCACGDTCILYPYRFGKRPDIKPALTPIKAIKAKCYDCSENNKAEQRRCEFKNCVLWPYRLGHNPKLKGKGNPNIGRFAKKTTVQELVLV